MTGIMCVLLYCASAIICFEYCKCKDTGALGCLSLIHRRKKMPIKAIVVLSILFSMINVYATTIATNVGGDRINYTYEYATGRKTSKGLDFLFKIAHALSLDINMIFYLATFVTCVCLFIAYRNLTDAGYFTILFLLCTNVVFFSFTGLKQTFAVGFAALFFSTIMQEKTLKNIILGLIFLMLSCLFHSTGYILIPIYIYYLINNTAKKYFWIIFISMIVCTLFLRPMCLLVANVAQGVVPTLSNKILEYFGSNYVSDKSLTFLRGMPYYLLFCFGCIFRKMLKEVYDNYDEYLLITLVAILFYLFSYQSYWMYRFMYVFYLPMGVLFDRLVKSCSPSNSLLIRISVGAPALLLTLREVVMVFGVYGGF